MGSCRVEHRPTYAVDALVAGSVRDVASAQATPNREQITLRGTVQAVDATARTVTIRGADGNVATLDVPASVAAPQRGQGRRRRERGVLRSGECHPAPGRDARQRPARAADRERDARRAARRHRRAAARDDGDDYRLGPGHARGDVHRPVGRPPTRAIWWKRPTPTS